jgi:hypothetical protein
MISPLLGRLVLGGAMIVSGVAFTRGGAGLHPRPFAMDKLFV